MADRLVHLAEIVAAGRLPGPLATELGRAQQAIARTHPPDRGTSSGHLSSNPPVEPNLAEFATTGQTRTATADELRELVAQNRPVWVHRYRAGGRWLVTVYPAMV